MAPGATIDQLFDDFEAWMSAHEPNLLAQLEPPATSETIAECEASIGSALPANLRSALARRNGLLSVGRALHQGFIPLSAEGVASKYNLMSDLAETSVHDYGEEHWWQGGWIPFASNGGGDLLCIDVDPDDGQVPGQIVRFIHDDESSTGTIAPSLEAWLAAAFDAYRHSWAPAPTGAFSGHSELIMDVAWGSDKPVIASAGGNELRLWDANSGELLVDRFLGPRTMTARFSPDGRRLASQSGGVVTVIDVSSPGEPDVVFEASSSYLGTLDWSPDGERIATIDVGSDSIKIWDSASGEVVAEWPAFIEGGLLARGRWSADGRWIVAADNGSKVIRWDTTDGDLTQIKMDSVGHIEWAPDSRTFASASYHRIRLWDIENMQPNSEIGQHDELISAIAWSPNGAYLASASYDWTYAVWDVNTGDLVQRFTPEPTENSKRIIRPSTVAWSPDSARIVTGDLAGRLDVYDLVTSQ